MIGMIDKIFRKALATIIIVFLLGVGFQPALANEVSITKASDIKEDCNCNPVNNLPVVRIEKLLNRVEGLLNRLVIHNIIILILVKNNPEVIEKYQDISSRIATLREMNKEFKSQFLSDNEPFICIFIESMFYFFGSILYVVEKTWEKFLDYPIISKLLENLIDLIYIPLQIIGFLAFLFQCDL